MSNEELTELFIEMKSWHENIKNQLQQIVSAPGKTKIMYTGDNSRQMEVPEKHIPGIKIGVSLALHILGEFPLKISNNDQD